MCVLLSVSEALNSINILVDGMLSHISYAFRLDIFHAKYFSAFMKSA